MSAGRTTIQKLMDEAEAALADPNVTRERLAAAHLQLNTWHRTVHGGPRNSVLCTGCAVYPVLQDLQFALLIFNPDGPQLVGRARHEAQMRMVDAFRPRGNH